MIALIGPHNALASKYGDAPPKFDQLTMLMVAKGYNSSRNGAPPLPFPSRSGEACKLAGVSALTFVVIDHSGWASGPGHPLLVDAHAEAVEADPENPHCYWLHSDFVAGFFSGLPRIWPATLKENFNRLRKGLRKRDCEQVINALGRYPTPEVSAAKIRQRISIGWDRPCRARRR